METSVPYMVSSPSGHWSVYHPCHGRVSLEVTGTIQLLTRSFITRVMPSHIQVPVGGKDKLEHDSGEAHAFGAFTNLMDQDKVRYREGVVVQSR